MKYRYHLVKKGGQKPIASVAPKVEAIHIVNYGCSIASLEQLEEELQSFHEDRIFFNDGKGNVPNGASSQINIDHFFESFQDKGESTVAHMIDTKPVMTVYKAPPKDGQPSSAEKEARNVKNAKYIKNDKVSFAKGAYRGGRRKKASQIFGDVFEGNLMDIIAIQGEQKGIIIEGEINGIEEKAIKDFFIVSFNIVDKTDGISCSVFIKEKDEVDAFLKDLKKSPYMRLKGDAIFNKHMKDFSIRPTSMFALPVPTRRSESREDSRVELHLHTKMSDRDALISVKELIGTIKSWGHPAVAITDHGVVQAFPEAQFLAAEKGVKIIYGVEGYLIEDEESTTRYHIIILAKNEIGIRNLYKLISLSHLNFYKRRPRIPRAIIEELREGLILGTACEAGELIQKIIAGESWEELKRIASFYDYLEVQPISNNTFLIHSGKIADEEGLRHINRQIVQLGEELNKPVIATSDAHYLHPEEKIYREIIMANIGYKDAHLQPDLYLRTTEEMLDEFSYLGEEKAYEIVVTNSRALNDSIDAIKPIPDGTYAPKIDGADEALEKMCYEKAKSIYGNPLPTIVKDRLEYELKSIIGHGFGVLYYIAHKLVTKSLSDGYLVGSRGSVGSSFVATMADITEVNPLQPHYVCPHCKYSEFITDGSYAGGFDLPRKDCPSCGHPLKTNGHDIPFAIFMGFDGDKVPDIDLNFSGDYQAKAHKYTEELFGRDNVFRAGTIGTIAEKTAFMYAKKYSMNKGIQCRNSYYELLARGMTKVKNTTGQHPGGIMVCPRDMDIHHFTPVQYPANKKESGIITTHFDYHSIEGRMTKLDILGHDDPTIIRLLEDMTGIDPQTVPFDDPDTLKLFYSTESLGLTPEDLKGDTVATLGIPEFGTGFVRQMLNDSKPKTFSELVRISGFSHGTNVWLDNAKDLITAGTCTISEAISTRDDIMTYLIHQGIEPIISFSIMENVRKGKGIEKKNKQGEVTTNYIETLREGNIPEWFIESCSKISYLFPKAHAVAYVMMAFRIAWFKINEPLAFYASYFSIRAKAFDCKTIVPGLAAQEAEYERIKHLDKKERSNKEDNLFASLEVAIEMAKRGYSFKQVDIWKSHATCFIIDDGKLLPPFIAVDGLGETVAHTIVEQRESRPFTSILDVQKRGKVSATLIGEMKELGVFGDLPEEDQMSLF